MFVHVMHFNHYYNGCINGVPQWRQRMHGNGAYYRGLPLDTARAVVRQLETLGFNQVRMVDCGGETVA